MNVASNPSQLESYFDALPISSPCVTRHLLSRLKEWQSSGIPVDILVAYPPHFLSLQQLKYYSDRQIREDMISEKEDNPFNICHYCILA